MASLDNLSSYDIEKISLLWLLDQVSGLGPSRIRAICQHFHSFSDLKKAKARHLAEIDGIGQTFSEMVVQHPYKVSEPEETWQNIQKYNIRLIPFWSPLFPRALTFHDNMPTLIFLNGDPSVLQETRTLAIIGTRHPTPYGESVAESFSRQLTELGITIISGFARGIDTIAQQTCVAHGGKTVAVLGNGLGRVYPAENRKLVEPILQKGAFVTEYLPWAMPEAKHFPARNRIISGLSQGIIVVESRQTGGAMVTASIGLDQGKDIMAVPGSIFSPQSEGPNLLISRGHARLVRTIEEVLEELPEWMSEPSQKKTIPHEDLTFFENLVIQVLSDKPIHIDELSQRLEKTTTDLLIELLQMEFKGYVRQLPGKYFILGH